MLVKCRYQFHFVLSFIKVFRHLYVYELKYCCTSLPFPKPTATELDPSQFKVFKAVAFLFSGEKLFRVLN